ncbi:hypothetical protein G5I_09150 [Acromyrmex echinatior]|uniref:Uncharacterized protein n=1 Tax=Acromyrmex echinatior TaxID=103372 RepID=F4WTC1_ACREC|nr:hypothetical protein G5I_09150 [Acromyrmex echinatior]
MPVPQVGWTVRVVEGHCVNGRRRHILLAWRCLHYGTSCEKKPSLRSFDANKSSSGAAYGCVAHKQLSRATVLVVYRCDLVADRFISRRYNGTEIHPRASRRVGIIALFLAAEKCNSVRRAICRCPSRIIGVFDTHVRDRMKKNRKRSRGCKTMLRDTRNLRHAVVKMIVVVNQLHRETSKLRFRKLTQFYLGAKSSAGLNALDGRLSFQIVVGRNEIGESNGQLPVSIGDDYRVASQLENWC